MRGRGVGLVAVVFFLLVGPTAISSVAFAQQRDAPSGGGQEATTRSDRPTFDVHRARQLLRSGRSEAAFAILRPALERRDPAAIHLLGQAYISGYGVPVDAAEGKRLLRIAGDAGYAKAYATLAIVHIVDKDPPAMLQEALRLTRRALDAGEPRGLTALAFAYHNNLVPGKGEADAEALVQQAADAGDDFAREILATARALSAPTYHMSREEFLFFSPSGTDMNSSLTTADVVKKLEENPNVAEYYYQNVPPHPDCITDWHKINFRESYAHSKMVCSVYIYYMNRIVRVARMGMRWADSQMQIDNFRHHQEQSRRLRDEVRSARDLIRGYHGSYDLPSGGSEVP